MGEPESIGIRELRQHASRYVAIAKAGRRVAVTERGKLVAYLVPAEEPTTTFERLVAAGQVRRAEGRGIKAVLEELGPPPPPEPDEGSPFEELMRMRDEERY
jgi:prevent-host-death family protein